ncbi:MAG: hypothetical protein ACOX5F_01495 [Anaerovoracaceae bacterium]|jgi:acetyl-CoA carboxylase beta subunit
MKKVCKNCGYEPDFDNGWERCPKCYQLYVVEHECTKCKVCLGCMLNQMKTNKNERKDI